VTAFDLLRSWHHDHAAMLCAFDLIEVDGKDLRSGPIEERKRLLARVLRAHLSIALNETFGENGEIVFSEACKLGCEGIVSKRLGSPYRSARSAHWLKVKNPKAPAVKREAEEDWGR
jgi:bifunctional non-homologous end joining protein LigD